MYISIQKYIPPVLFYSTHVAFPRTMRVLIIEKPLDFWLYALRVQSVRQAAIEGGLLWLD